MIMDTYTNERSRNETSIVCFRQGFENHTLRFIIDVTQASCTTSRQPQAARGKRRTLALAKTSNPAAARAPVTRLLQSNTSTVSFPDWTLLLWTARAVMRCWWAMSVHGMGELCSAVRRRMCLRANQMEHKGRREDARRVLDPAVD
jgi:hypothetical protein